MNCEKPNSAGQNEKSWQATLADRGKKLRRAMERIYAVSPHFSHALRRLHHRKRFHCLIKLTWRMASNLPDFERTFPPPPVGEVGGEVCGLAVSGSWGSGAGAARQGMRQGKFMLIRAGRGDSDMDPAHADLYQSADLQQFQPDAAATGPGELGEGQADAA